MSTNLTVDVRKLSNTASVLDLKGDVNAAAEPLLVKAYTEATANGAKAIILNFTNLAYMNSTGIGLLVTLLVRAQRQGQALMAFGLSSHYRQIFDLTRLDEVIKVFSKESEAAAAAV